MTPSIISEDVVVLNTTNTCGVLRGAGCRHHILTELGRARCLSMVQESTGSSWEGALDQDVCFDLVLSGAAETSAAVYFTHTGLAEGFSQP